MGIFLSLALAAGLSATSHAQSASACGSAPAFTIEEAYALREWAVGGAFRLFAKQAGAEFDFASYKDDCPNWAAFGYALHSGPGCFAGVEVTSTYLSYMFLFERDWGSNRERFNEFYWSEAKRTGFSKYLRVTEASQ